MIETSAPAASSKADVPTCVSAVVRTLSATPEGVLASSGPVVRSFSTVEHERRDGNYGFRVIWRRLVTARIEERTDTQRLSRNAVY